MMGTTIMKQINTSKIEDDLDSSHEHSDNINNISSNSTNNHDDITILKQRINDLEKELKALKDEKAQWQMKNYQSEALPSFPIITKMNELHLLFGSDQYKEHLHASHANHDEAGNSCNANLSNVSPSLSSIIMSHLSHDEIKRYCRQLLVENGIIDTIGQLKIRNARVLVVGAGGIGSTVLLYLSGFGIGTIGVIDYDTIEVSNLHRQIIHTNTRIGINKSISACTSIKCFNPTINCHAITYPLDTMNAIEIIQYYDIVIDASDNPVTRYVINDASIFASNKPPLISGSAIGYEGQITVYNYKNGPCYRCLYPNPKISASCASCSDIGVYGPVPGLIGILQSMEAIKVITNESSSSSTSTLHDRMILYDAIECTFQTIKKSKKHPKCPICSDNPSIRSMTDSQTNLLYCRGPNNTNNSNDTQSSPSASTLINHNFHITCRDYKRSILDNKVHHILIDVRMKHQFAICSLRHSINIPLEDIIQNKEKVYEKLVTLSSNHNKTTHDDDFTIYCICRRGIASTEATNILQQYVHEQQQQQLQQHDHTTTFKRSMMIRNIQGGLTAWQQQVDPNFPIY